MCNLGAGEVRLSEVYDVVGISDKEPHKILLTNLRRRGFAKHHQHSNVPSSLPSPKTATQEEICAEKQATPSKCESMDDTCPEAPLERRNLDESDMNPAADIFECPPVTGTASKYGMKSLNMYEVNEYIIKTTLNIALIKIEIDIENSINNFRGPWCYNDSAKTWIHYREYTSSNKEPSKIRLNSLRKRGFGTKYTYKWYSWLRFKDLAKKQNTYIKEVLTDKKKFMDILYKVNFYYQQHPEYAIQEGLEVYKGPQTYDQKTNEIALRYYGTVCQGPETDEEVHYIFHQLMNIKI